MSATQDQITQAEYRTYLENAVSEASFQHIVQSYATLMSWLCYHTYDSRRSDEGFPDLVAVRGTRMVIAELKVKRGKLSLAQEVWQEALLGVAGAAPFNIQYFVWKPAQWEQIITTFARD